MSAALSVVTVLGVLLAPQNQGPAPSNKAPSNRDLEVALARVIDLPAAAERKQAVSGLLDLSQDLERWLHVCREFGDFEQLPAGPMDETRKLHVLGEEEETDLHLYVPKNYDPGKPAPLLLWGHGAGGTGENQHTLWRDVADQIGMLVLAPTEPIATGYSKEPRERESTLQALRWARRVANVDENAIFIGGWSRGGHLAWDMALRHPDHFAGVIPCIGGPRMEIGPFNNMRYLENVVQLPIRDLQGSQDDPRLLMNLRLAFKSLKKLRAKDAKFIEFADRGHDADLSAVDWTAFFKKRRPVQPKKVVRLAADPAETRAAWLEITGMRQKVQVNAQPRVSVRNWERLTEMQKREHVLKALAKNTARLEVTQKGPGRFVAKGTGITKFSMLLTRKQLGKKDKVDMRLANKPIKKAVRQSPKVLLDDFVERFDRTRLPVVRVDF